MYQTKTIVISVSVTVRESLMIAKPSGSVYSSGFCGLEATDYVQF